MPSPYLGCVYLATNTANGSIYIGKSKLGLAFRRRTHEKGRDPTVFLNAIRKHGKEAFDWIEIYCSDDDRALLDAEVALIETYRAASFRMYNMTKGGDGCAGRKVTPEQLEKMRRPRSESAKANMRAGQTAAVRAAKGAAQRGRVRPEHVKAAVSAAQKGRKRTPEQIAAIIERQTGGKLPPWSDERRAKMEAAWSRRREQGLTISDETRRRMSDAAKRRRK